MRFSIVLLLSTLTFSLACSQQPKSFKTVIHGVITVDSTLDASKDYSGIHLLVAERDADDNVDTLFHAITDKNGAYKGVARFNNKGRMPFFVFRNGKLLSTLSIILGSDDSLKITGQLPNFSETRKIDSREHIAFEVYNRMIRNVERVSDAIVSGAVKQDTIQTIIENWSNNFWQLGKQYPNTQAANLGILESFNVLDRWNDKILLERYHALPSEELKAALALTARDATLRLNGNQFQKSFAFIDSVKKTFKQKDMKAVLDQNQIEWLADSLQFDTASRRMASFMKDYYDLKDFMDWAKFYNADLTYFRPGRPVPDFEFEDLNGKKHSKQSMLGKVYVLEITGLANRAYLDQYARMTGIYSVYRMFGLEILTLTLDNNQALVDGFFEERVKVWPFAEPNSFNVTDVLDRFNVEIIPTRLLIDKEGKIVRKYIGKKSDEFLVRDIAGQFSSEN